MPYSIVIDVTLAGNFRFHPTLKVLINNVIKIYFFMFSRTYKQVRIHWHVQEDNIISIS